MSSDIFAQPTPAVEYLPAIFRRIRLGEIRVPAFQRGFEWEQQQIVALLQSVYQGFPIGSILLWKVTQRTLKLQSPHETPFPEVDERYPLFYVLDGMQRLSTLYGVCHYDGPPTTADLFNVVFDLTSEQFRHVEDDVEQGAHVPLSTLFSPRSFLDVQSRLAAMPDGDALIDRAVKLHSLLQEYLIPTVTISDRSLEEVVQIFERVNSTGVRLGPVDFMRAVTWSEDFDLTVELRDLNLHLAKSRFSLSEETLVKILGLTLGYDPLPGDLLSLRSRSAVELRRGIAMTKEVVECAAGFLRERFLVMSSDYIPYEGQMLVLAKAFLDTRTLDNVAAKRIERWFWSTSLNEGLKGKPDNFVARTVRAVGATLRGERGSLVARLTISETDFVDKRFIVGKAMSSALASMFAVHQARSLETGQLIAPPAYMTEFDQSHFEPVLDLPSVNRITRSPVVSARIMSNIVVYTDVDRFMSNSRTVRDLIVSLSRAGEEGERVLASQFITLRSAHALSENDYMTFARTRATAMLSFARLMVQGNEVE